MVERSCVDLVFPLWLLCIALLFQQVIEKGLPANYHVYDLLQLHYLWLLDYTRLVVCCLTTRDLHRQ
jgi:hypothetical protein